MATVIDALVVTLGLDASQFKPNAAAARLEIKITVEQAERAAKLIEASGKTAANFFTKLRTEALGLLALFLGGKGVGAFVSETVTSLSALGRAAANLNMPVEELAAFRNLIVRAGGSAESAEGTIRSLSAAMQTLKTVAPDRGFLSGLQQIGGQPTDRPLEIIRRFSEWAARTNAADPNFGGARVSQIGELLHIPQDVINGINKGVVALDAAMAESKRLDALVPGMSDRATALQEAWRGMREAADSFGRVLLDDLTPILTTILNWIKEGIVWVRDLAISHHGWATAITIVATALFSLNAALRVFSLLRLALGGVGLITALFGGGAGALSAIAGGVGAVTTGVTALTGALSALLVPLAAVAAWYTALHISSGAGSEELAAEKKHTEDRAREHPEEVLPPEPKVNPAKEWAKRNFPSWMLHREDQAAPAADETQAPAAPTGAATPAAPAAPTGAPAPAVAGGRPGTYRPGDLQAAMGISDAQYDAFRRGVTGIEGARYDQMGGSSGRFAGRYQMGAAEIAETARRLGEPVPSQQQFLANPAMQDRFFEAYTAGHHATLMAGSARYRAMSPNERLGTLGYAQNQGATGAIRYLETGQAKRDAFGTSGAAYAGAIQRNLGAPKIDPAIAAVTRPAPPSRPTQLAQNDNSSETHIGAITIHTQATDARGIAASIDPAIRRRQGLVAQATTGLS